MVQSSGLTGPVLMTPSPAVPALTVEPQLLQSRLPPMMSVLESQTDALSAEVPPSVLLTVSLATLTPFASHVLAPGPHRYQVSVPPQEGEPVICSVAESVPDEIVPFAAICFDVEPKFCWVVSDPPQPPSWLRVKSNSVAVGLAEDRVSGATVLKHEGVVPPWPWNAWVMSIPPSKKSGD